MLINILGLAIGLTCFLFILIYINHELSFDRYHKNSDQIYRIDFGGSIFDQELDIPQTGSPFGPFLVESFPEIQQQVRLRDRGGFLVQYEDNSYKEDDIIFADSTLFDVFSFSLIEGNPKTALTKPNTMVITPKIAKKYFGTENPIGKNLKLSNRTDYQVTGILAPIPENSHFNFDIFLSMSSLDESRNNQWLSMNFTTYIQVAPNTNLEDLENKIGEMTKTQIGGEIQQYLNVTYEDFIAKGNRIAFLLFPMNKIHLYSNKDGELAANGDVKYIYIFGAVGLFILLLACINFMNLSTARSSNRAKEVGLRKVIGAERKQLILQFLSESIILTFLALIVAIGLIIVLLPQFNLMADKDLTLWQINQLWLWGVIVLMIFGVGILAGSYPAFFLSAFRPIQTLKGQLLGSNPKKNGLRNGLVVFQFTVTIILIMGTLVVYDQLQYIQNKKLGFEKDHLLVLEDTYILRNNLMPFNEAIRSNAEVVNTTISGYLPGPNSNRNNSTAFLGKSPTATNTQVIQQFSVDFDYIPTYEMEIIEGRAFSKEFSTDSSAVILNESAAAIFGISENPIGQEIGTFGDNDGEFVTWKVVGVVKDFHYNSLREKIGPLALFLRSDTGNITMRINSNNINQLLSWIEQKWNQFAPGQPFNYEFLDESFDELYRAENRIGTIIRLFTFLAIVVACLGLLGLATYTAERRTKEIGVRKVLGAPISSIYLLLTSQFTKWVLVANLVALPIGYFVMRRWLQSFEYQVKIGWSTLLFAALLGIIIAILTVSFHTLKAARLNPIESLKHE